MIHDGSDSMIPRMKGVTKANEPFYIPEDVTAKAGYKFKRKAETDDGKLEDGRPAKRAESCGLT
jgi:hypothetical protein